MVLDYCLLIITDGRQECLARTIESAHENLPRSPWPVIVNDYPDREWQDHLDRTYGDDFQIYHLIERQGFSGAIQYAWNLVPMFGAKWVFHLEDDFIFHGDVPLIEMSSVMNRNPAVKQMVLKRQPWSREEIDAGGVIQLREDDFAEVLNGSGSWTEHRLFWSTNPSLYKTEICKMGWPDPPGSEGAFSSKLFEDDRAVVAFWGKKDDPPLVEHIGLARVGHGY